ncbi:hypothetical protein VE02_10364, partial [Pseudogymnoascus sp. 03VT05]
LGAQDVIIRKKLFSRFRILLDSAKSQLSKEITLPYYSRETSIRHPAYQSDANRRDAAILHKDRRCAGGRLMEMKVIISASPEKTTGTTLSLPQIPEEPSLPLAKSVLSFTPVQICEIGANAFHHEMMRNDSEFFQTSIYEIDQII